MPRICAPSEWHVQVRCGTRLCAQSRDATLCSGPGPAPFVLWVNRRALGRPGSGHVIANPG